MLHTYKALDQADLKPETEAEEKKIAIYKSLFKISFATLRKIKIRGSPQDMDDSIISL